MKKIKDSDWDIVKEYLWHFYDPSEKPKGWDLRVTPDEAKAVKRLCRYLSVAKCKKHEVDDDRTYWVRETKKFIDKDHLLRYYKEEAAYYKSEAQRLEDGITALLNGHIIDGTCE